MTDSTPIKSTLPILSEWTPKWTVITTPPGVAERWAMRAMRRGRQGGVSVLVAWLLTLAFAGLRAWNNADMSWVLAVVLFAVTAVFAWDCYAFGQLLERYDAELRDVQSRRDVPLARTSV